MAVLIQVILVNKTQKLNLCGHLLCRGNLLGNADNAGAAIVGNAGICGHGHRIIRGVRIFGLRDGKGVVFVQVQLQGSVIRTMDKPSPMETAPPGDYHRSVSSRTRVF